MASIDYELYLWQVRRSLDPVEGGARVIRVGSVIIYDRLLDISRMIVAILLSRYLVCDADNVLRC